ncbi:MAG: SGNH/GDSL hydrolase family protein [Rhodanobacteraceae bacterium]
MLAGESAAGTQVPGFLALGDSYTIGEGVSAQDRWPEQLVERLDTDGSRVGAPTIIAKTGWTTSELAQAIDATTLHPPYALVTLMIGVNDQYQGRAVDYYRVGFSALLVRAIALAGKRPDRVLVISIPDWGVTRFAHEQGHHAAQVSNAIDAFNAAARDIAADHHVAWVDVTAVSRTAGANAGMLSEDGLHPSGAQYAHWTDVILPAAEATLRATD